MGLVYIGMKQENYVKYVIRKALENKKHWVVEVYYNNRDYPNIISGRFTTKKLAMEAIRNHKSDDSKFTFWGNVC